MAIGRGFRGHSPLLRGFVLRCKSGVGAGYACEEDLGIDAMIKV